MAKRYPYSRLPKEKKKIKTKLRFEKPINFYKIYIGESVF